MLVHQCNSCQALSKHQGFHDVAPGLPSKWGRIELTLPGENTPRIYDLCAECLTKPITFGNIKLGSPM